MAMSEEASAHDLLYMEYFVGLNYADLFGRAIDLCGGMSRCA